MIPALTGLMFGAGFLFAVFLFGQPAVKSSKKKKIYLEIIKIKSLQLDKYQEEARQIGWTINKKDLLTLVFISAALSLLLSLLTSNPFILIAGVITGMHLPKFIIDKKRQANRRAQISRLTDPLRMLLSRIPDQQNITRAIEVTKNEVTDENIKQLFTNYLSDVSIGGSVKDALLGMKKSVKLRKFDIFIEHLTQAHYEGFTADAMKALDKAIEAMEFDLRAIEKVKEKCKTRKKQLYASLGTVWLFLPILSFINAGYANVYLDTLAGKVLILMYFIGSVYVCIKGEEYLSLNLDEM